MSHKRRIITLLISIGIVGCGALACLLLVRTAPRTEPEEKVRASRIVQVMEVSPGTEQVFVSNSGTVIPARQVDIKPQVRGRIVSLHEALVPGGYLDAGEELIRIDPSDYEIALTEKQSAREEAEFEAAVEQGRQVVAAREWTLLEQEMNSQEVDRSLVLREPHLRRAKAVVQKADAEIERARLDLDRTSLTAPFNAFVLEETAELGQLAEPGNTICTLVGTDEFWIRASIDFSKLQNIRLPAPDAPGAKARVILNVGDQREVWEGRVVRLLGNLDEGVRMAHVLIAIDDPMGLKSSEHRTPLLVGSYVDVEIEAGTLENAIRVPRTALREGGKLWVADENDELQIRDASVLWQFKDDLLVANNLQPGERLIVSGLRTALPGMKVNPRSVGTQGEKIADAGEPSTP